MSYTKEQRAANAAAAASKASEAIASAPAQVEASDPEGPTNQEPSRGLKLRNDPRNEAMAEVIARHEKGVELPTPDPEPTPDPVAAPAPTDDSAPAAVESTVAVVPVMVKQKVDGVEIEVSQEEIDAAGGEREWRMQKASENRLTASKQALAEAQQARNEAKQMQVLMAQFLQQQAPKQPVVTDDQFLLSKIDVIRFGSAEESAQAMREVMQRSNPRIDTNVITQQAVSQMQQKMAIDAFAKEFQDVASNSILLRAAMSLENERRAQTGPNTDWSMHYRSIGNEVRSGAGRPSQPQLTAAAATTDTPSQAPSDKEARKASIVNLPTAAQRATPSADPKPESREDILNSMRKTRGQPTG